MSGSGVESSLKISVFVPTLDRADNLRDCLQSLVDQAYDNFDVVVVDGGSTDDTQVVVEEFSSRLNLVFATVPGGLIPQANAGWRLATGDVITRTDDDVVASREWLSEIAKTFRSNERVGGVTGPTIIPEQQLDGRDLTYFNKRLQHPRGFLWRVLSIVYYRYFMEDKPFAVGRFFKSGAFSLGSNYSACLELKDNLVVDHLEACNGSYRRQLVEQVGGFDEKYVGIGEYHEPDLAFRIKGLGYKLVFNPAAAVQHRPSVAGVFEARPHAFGRSQNFILFYFRHIKPNTVDKFCRFSAYLAFVNAYWISKFLMTRNPRVLAGLPGTFVGLIRYAPEIWRRR